MQCVLFFFNPRLARVFWFSSIVLATGADLVSAAVPALSLDFERTLNARAEPPQLHYQATCIIQGQTRQTETWRDADRRLRRVTDGRLETQVFKPENQDDWRMMALATAAEMPKAVARCSWYGLTRNGVASHLCWSTGLRLPLVVTDAANLVQWRVTAVDTQARPGSTFDIDDAGFVHNNANEEIQSG